MASSEPSGKVNLDLARDHLANERTLLAWLRTSVAVMALGFVVARFGILLRELGAKSTQTVSRATGLSTVFGTVLVGCGGLLVVLAVISYVGRGRAIEQRAYRWSPALVIFLAVVVVLVAVLLAIYLLFTG
ncbi:MAG TPA: DUF202 domain-containing protein [Chloroflexota bacterium]|jgi:putative membrane protein